MAYSEIDIDWLEQLIVPAIDMFYANENDIDLIIRNAAERAIVANIYYRINKKIRSIQEEDSICQNLSVDVDYNRNYNDSKRAYEKCNMCTEQACFIKEKSFFETVMSPDILVHERGNNLDNQVVIEFKKKSNLVTSERNKDKAILTFLTCQKPFPNREEENYQFRYGFFIDLGVYDYSVTPYIDSIPQPIRNRRGGQWI